MKTESILTRVNAIMAMHKDPTPARTELEKLAADLAAQLRMECAASKGNASALRTVNAILKRVRKEGLREQLMYAWTDGQNRQCICDGFTAYRLREHLPLDERPESAGLGIDLDKIIAPAIACCTMQLTLPSVGELKAHIAVEHAQKGRKHTPLWDFGLGRPLVNALYLQELLAVLPDVKLYCRPGRSGLGAPLYAASERGDGVLLPVCVSDAARAAAAEQLALEARAEALFADARKLTSDQRSVKLHGLYREYRSNVRENEAYALSLEGFAGFAALAFHPAA